MISCYTWKLWRCNAWECRAANCRWLWTVFRSLAKVWRQTHTTYIVWSTPVAAAPARYASQARVRPFQAFFTNVLKKTVKRLLLNYSGKFLAPCYTTCKTRHRNYQWVIEPKRLKNRKTEWPEPPWQVPFPNRPFITHYEMQMTADGQIHCLEVIIAHGLLKHIRSKVSPYNSKFPKKMLILLTHLLSSDQKSFGRFTCPKCDEGGYGTNVPNEMQKYSTVWASDDNHGVCSNGPIGSNYTKRLASLVLRERWSWTARTSKGLDIFSTPTNLVCLEKVWEHRTQRLHAKQQKWAAKIILLGSEHGKYNRLKLLIELT